MKTIELTRGYVASVDDEDYEYVSKYKWYAALRRGLVYAARNSRVTEGTPRRVLLLHRQVMKAAEDELIDHHDGDGLNDRKHNLRRCNTRENIANSKPQDGGSSKYKGVSFCNTRHKFVAVIRVNYKRINLGYFTNDTDAARAYDNGARTYFGEFARTNFPLQEVNNE